MQYKAAIFDLDGTLVDSLVDLAESANTMLEHYNYPTHPVDSYRMMVGDGSKKLIERCMPPGIDEYRINAGLAYYKKIYEGRFLEKTRSYQGVLDLLKELRAEEIPLAVCTNKHKEAAHMIVGILFEENTFSEVIGDEPGLPRKPDPAPLHETLRCMGGGPAAYVGDSEVDAETAQRAGLPFLLFTEGYRKAPVSALPHAIAFSDFAMLPGIVAHWPWQVDPASS